MRKSKPYGGFFSPEKIQHPFSFQLNHIAGMKSTTLPDPYFRVEIISSTPNPQQVIYAAMHQDYSEGFVYDEKDSWPDEKRAGEIAVKQLLSGGRGHFGPLEHPGIVFNCGWFPHSVMQQARTHRVGISMDCQCLAGDTEITFLKSGSSKNNIKISDLYDLWTNGEKAVRERKIRGRKGESPGSYRRDCKKRLKKMRLRVLNEDSKEFQTSHIRNVMCSGVKPVYRLTMEDGKTLDCTTNHRLFTPGGWRTMEQAVSLKIKSDGSVASFRKTAQVYANGKISSGTGDVHPLTVVNVEYLGEQLTYDLEVEDPWHNFVANGLIVHNSMRYTGERVCQAARFERDLEGVFYLRPVGAYADRKGKKYEYTASQREIDLGLCRDAALRYAELIDLGYAEEHARGILPFDVRQHFVVSFNLRSVLHFMDLRSKSDAQPEIQTLCDLMWPHVEAWAPEIAGWYGKNRLHKARLAP